MASEISDENMNMWMQTRVCSLCCAHQEAIQNEPKSGRRLNKRVVHHVHNSSKTRDTQIVTRNTRQNRQTKLQKLGISRPKHFKAKLFQGQKLISRPNTYFKAKRIQGQKHFKAKNTFQGQTISRPKTHFKAKLFQGQKHISRPKTHFKAKLF